MQVEVLYRSSYSLARVTLAPTEQIQVEAGVMVGMSPTLQMETQASGGLLKSLGCSIFGKESFFLNTYKGKATGDTIALAPALPDSLMPGGLHLVSSFLLR